MRELLVLMSRGGIAQLAEHLHGMQGVRGSNPRTSTKNRLGRKTEAIFFFATQSVPVHWAAMPCNENLK